MITTLTDVGGLLDDHVGTLERVLPVLDGLANDGTPAREAVELVTVAREAIQRAAAVCDGRGPTPIGWADVPSELERIGAAMGDRPPVPPAHSWESAPNGASKRRLPDG